MGQINEHFGFAADNADARMTNSLESLARGLGDRVNKVKQEVGDQAQHLWQEAYEHRGEGAVVAGAVAVGVVGLIAARGQLARAAAREVLLVEDSPYMAKAFKSTLEANGEKVTWLTGVRRVSPLTGMTAAGKDVIFDPRKFKIAFVDGDLQGSYLQGEHVVHALRQGGLTSIGTSSEVRFNQAMLDNGAKIAAPKATVLSALIHNSLDLKAAVRAPAQTQVGLEHMTEALRGPSGKELRNSGDCLLMKCIAEDTTL